MGSDVELSMALVHAEGGSVESDDITESVDNRKLLESLGVYNNSGEFLAVKSGVNNLERGDELFGVGLVGESGIDDHTVYVVGVGGCHGDLAEFSVLVALSLSLRGALDWSGRFLDGSGWHFRFESKSLLINLPGVNFYINHYP